MNNKRLLEYEKMNFRQLLKKTPVVVKLDGVAFKTFTKGMRVPFDDKIMLEAMRQTTMALCRWIPGCVFGYTHSDKIELVLVQRDENVTPFLNYNVDKMTCTISSYATMKFNSIFSELVRHEFKGETTDESRPYRRNAGNAYFRCSCFNVVEEDVIKYLEGKQEDAILDSVRQYYGCIETDKKDKINKASLQELMQWEHASAWLELPTRLQRGTSCVKVKQKVEIPAENGLVKYKVVFPWMLDTEVPEFDKNKAYVTDRVTFNGDFKA